MPRRAYGEYPSNVSDEQWAFCAPYLTLMREDAPQREYPLRDAFNALRWFVRADCPWRQMPNDLPPWWVVQQQCQRSDALTSIPTARWARVRMKSTSLPCGVRQ